MASSESPLSICWRMPSSSCFSTAGFEPSKRVTRAYTAPPFGHVDPSHRSYGLKRQPRAVAKKPLGEVTSPFAELGHELHRQLFRQRRNNADVSAADKRSHPPRGNPDQHRAVRPPQGRRAEFLSKKGVSMTTEQ